MTPAVAAARLGWSLALGAGSGLVYDFLHPPQLRRPHLADGIFMVFYAWAWLRISFGICAGDIRMGCFWGQMAGLVFWEITAGRPMRRLWGRFWKRLAGFLRIFLVPLKKFFDFLKNLFASAEKWVTI